MSVFRYTYMYICICTHVFDLNEVMYMAYLLDIHATDQMHFYELQKYYELGVLVT